MRKPRKLDDIINGFVVKKDLGYIKNGTRYAIFECKVCGKDFQSQVILAKTRKSCGCISYFRHKELPKYINGFRIIKDLGRNKEKKFRQALVQCKECNREYVTEPYQLKYRDSCNCKVAGTKVSKYVHIYPDLLHCLRRIKARCYNEKNNDYYNYGARGIKVCDEWMQDQDLFVEWAINNKWNKNLSIDRINNELGYSPENCRWATNIEQARNKRNNKITFELAERIREQFKNGENVKNLSIYYKTHITNIRSILKYKTWKIIIKDDSADRTT